MQQSVPGSGRVRVKPPVRSGKGDRGHVALQVAGPRPPPRPQQAQWAWQYQAQWAGQHQAQHAQWAEHQEQGEGQQPPQARAEGDYEMM